VFVGGTLGTAVGAVVGTTVGLGVVGAGVLVVGKSVGVFVGPCVGTQYSKASRRILISLYSVGLRGDAKSFHRNVPYGGT